MTAACSLNAALSVVIVNDFAVTTGGCAKVALAEARGLAERGHDVRLLAGQGRPSPSLLETGVQAHVLGDPTTLGDPHRLRAARRGVWNGPAAQALSEIAAELDPAKSVIHVHGYTKVLSASVIKAALDSGLPTVATLHDYFAACPNGGFFNYQRGETCHLTPLSGRCVATHCDARAYSHKLWRVARTAIQRDIAGMPGGLRAFIAPSRFAADVMAPFLPVGAQVTIVANPVEIERQPAADVSVNTTFAYLGRLDRDKAPETFARAARRAQVSAVFAGDGEQAESLRTAFPEASYPGWLEASGVRATLRGARALVCPSSWYEVQPLAPLEAAAQGVPAIVSDVGAFREAVVDGETGLWFRGGDSDDLADKLARLDRDPLLAARMGRAAYDAFWSQPRGIAIHLDRLESVYRQLEVS